MSKKGFIIGIILCVVVASAVVVAVVNRNTGTNTDTDSENSSGTVTSSEQITEANLNGESGKPESAVVSQDVAKQENVTTAEKMETESSKAAENSSVQTVLVTVAEEELLHQSSDTADSTSNGQKMSLESEGGEIELPAEMDIPEDWDWGHIPIEESKIQETPIVATEASSTADGTEPTKEDATKQAEEQTSPEEKSPVESSSEEQSSEEGSTEETSPVESSSEEPSSEETSTEETEPETTTLSPEEQASIVESATAPIELPPIFFN